MKRVRIEEFFRDYDKLRKGKVTIPQFKGILSVLNFKLTDEEFNSIAAKYQTDDPDGKFNYFAFCDSINKVFTQKGVDKEPTHKIQPLTQNDTILARRKYLEITEDEIQNENLIVAEYKKAIANKRLNLKPMFKDFDITSNGHCSKLQFMRVLTQLGISAPENIMNLLLKRYMDRGNIDEVNYVDFCNDIDSPEDIFGVGRDYNQSFNYYPKNQPIPVGTDIVRYKPDDIEDVLARLRKQCS